MPSKPETALMPFVQQGLTPEQTEREMIIKAMADEDTELMAQNFKPPRYKLVSLTGQFQNTATEDVVKEIHGVILAFRNVRALWPEEEGGANRTPICTSTDSIIGISPQPDEFAALLVEKELPVVADPDQPMKCLVCPFNRWDSGKNGRGKACKEMRRLMIIEEGGTLPVTLSLPPTSIDPFKNYVTGLRTQKEAYFSVVTAIGAEKVKNAFGNDFSKVTFGKVGPLNPEALKMVLAFRQEYERFIGEEVVADEFSAEA